jgi:hypothetical protein
MRETLNWVHGARLARGDEEQRICDGIESWMRMKTAPEGLHSNRNISMLLWILAVCSAAEHLDCAITIGRGKTAQDRFLLS